MNLRETIDRINECVRAGRASNIGGPRTIEVEVSDRGELVTALGLPAVLVGRFRVTPLSPWVRWTCNERAAFPSMCAAFDRMTEGGDR